MDFIYNDGGRKEAGFKGEAGDCVTRAIAIITGKSYHEIYSKINVKSLNERRSKKSSKSTARTGVHTNRKWFKDMMKELGFKWVPTMGIGTGCKVHLKADELPSGRIICFLSKHVTAVINGVIHDIYDPSRNETRCVYGYYYL